MSIYLQGKRREILNQPGKFLIDVLIILLTGGINVLENAVVNGVQVLHIEGGEGQRSVELLGEETHPCVIPHKNNSLTFKPGEKKHNH